jgi:hypothetical protein
VVLVYQTEMRDEQSAVLDLWVYRADVADQRDLDLDVCLMPAVQASQHLLGQCRSRILWETFCHRGLSCRNHDLRERLSLGALGASDYAVDMFVLECDHVSRDVYRGRRCESFGRVQRNHRVHVQSHYHGKMTLYQEVGDQSRLSPQRGGRLVNFVGRG